MCWHSTRTLGGALAGQIYTRHYLLMFCIRFGLGSGVLTCYPFSCHCWLRRMGHHVIIITYWVRGEYHRHNLSTPLISHPRVAKLPSFPDMRRMPNIAKIEFADGKTYFTILQVIQYQNSCSATDISLSRSKFCHLFTTCCPPSTNHFFDLFAHLPRSLYVSRSKCKLKPTFKLSRHWLKGSIPSSLYVRSCIPVCSH